MDPKIDAQGILAIITRYLGVGHTHAAIHVLKDIRDTLPPGSATPALVVRDRAEVHRINSLGYEAAALANVAEGSCGYPRALVFDTDAVCEILRDLSSTQSQLAQAREELERVRGDARNLLDDVIDDDAGDGMNSQEIALWRIRELRAALTPAPVSDCGPGDNTNNKEAERGN